MLFSALAVFFTWPLATRLTGGTIGGPADNLNFVWDFWWVRHALSTGGSIFWTPAIFAPLGTSLATHTLIPIYTVPGAWLQPAVSPLTLYNVALLLSTFLNFVCAYAAARSLTGDRLASLFAAITFGGAPFLSVRLLGHLNVLSAWGIPLSLMAVHRYIRSPGVAAVIFLAVVLGAIAYTDYYYFIFAGLIVAIVLLQSRWDLRVTRRALGTMTTMTTTTPIRRRVLMLLAVLMATTTALIVWTRMTGGGDYTVAGVRIRLTDTFNLRVETGLLAAFALLTWWWPSATIRRAIDAADRRIWRFIPIGAGVLGVLLIPLVVAAVQLWRGGDYSSQPYIWRSAPPGIDLATFFVGNQLNPLTGAWTTLLFERFGINRMEGAGWLGIIPAVLLIFAIVRLRDRKDIRGYLWIAGVFFVWSLGPYLRILGYNTGVILPQTALRFFPIIANARIPGRAFIVVQLMTALIAATALASLRVERGRAGTSLTMLAIGLVLIDYWPISRPWERVDAPPLYETLRTEPDGVVLEVPLGLRDGFGSRGDVDHRTLFFQTIHEHPQMGGVISRLSKRIENGYEADPLVGPLLDLSEHRTPKLSDDPCLSSLACSVRYLVVDRERASEELTAFVDQTFVTQPLAAGDGRELSLVQAVRGCHCGGR